MKINNSSKKPTARRTVLNRPSWIIVIITGLILLAGQLSFDVVTLRNDAHSHDSTAITNLIISSVEGLKKPVPVDAQTGKLYVPEARLTWPATPDSFMQVLYSNQGGSGSLAQLNLTTSNLLSQGAAKLWTAQSNPGMTGISDDALFAQVPNLQACANGVQIFFSPQNQSAPQWQSQGTKKLQSGQTLYFYTQSTCKEDMSQLLKYVVQVQSY